LHQSFSVWDVITSAGNQTAILTSFSYLLNLGATVVDMVDVTNS